jgi:hypothetical protein
MQSFPASEMALYRRFLVGFERTLRPALWVIDCRETVSTPDRLIDADNVVPDGRCLDSTEERFVEQN